ncbi:hypothetical protein [Salaquimonas pukyongi]|uniref:hypothetical protein n=1 Tax=Salaquimonas pukyongi TaxID=2712698 RepID=UPI0012EC3A5D|nr:hypothetical protein [Salaquimonas pukyongi]
MAKNTTRSGGKSPTHGAFSLSTKDSGATVPICTKSPNIQLCVVFDSSESVFLLTLEVLATQKMIWEPPYCCSLIPGNRGAERAKRAIFGIFVSKIQIVNSPFTLFMRGKLPDGSPIAFTHGI